MAAGGHSLLPMMKLHRQPRKYPWDTTTWPRCRGRRNQQSQPGSLGAMNVIERSLDLLMLAAVPDLSAMPVIADPVVRNLSTLGGLLCQAGFAEDLSTVYVLMRVPGERGLV